MKREYFKITSSRSSKKDELLQSLIGLDNVVITAHQAFLTDTALNNMMQTTFANIASIEKGEASKNLVSP